MKDVLPVTMNVPQYSVIDSSSSDRVQKVDKLQNKAIRRIEYCIVPDRRVDIDELQVRYNIEKLTLRRKRNLLRIIHKKSKCKHNIEVDRPHMELRSKTKVILKNTFTGITKVYNSPLYRGLRLWDTLPSEVQKEENNAKFKSKLKVVKL